MSQSTKVSPARSTPSSWDCLRGRSTLALLLILLTVPLFYLAWHSDEMDFRAFYVAARATSSHLDPYADNRSQGDQFLDAETTVEMSSPDQSASRWIYPPSALFFVGPLAGLSYNTARLLFNTVSFASFIWALLYLANRFGANNVWVALAYVSIPVIACAQRGQIDILVLSCLVLSFSCNKRGWAGVPLGVAISIKIFPVVLLIWLLLQRRYREAVSATAVVVALGLLAEWRFGSATYVSFFHNLTAMHSTAALYADPMDLRRFGIPDLNYRLLALSSGFIGAYNNPLVLLGNLGIVLGLALTVAAAIWLRYSRVSDETGFFAMVLLSQLGNTALWAMGMVMYVPICLILVARVRSTGLALALMVPLYLPSELRILNVSPRYLIAAILVLCVIAIRPERAVQLYGHGAPANV